MTSITIITIVVVVLLTCVIFGLAWLGYGSCLHTYRMEVEAAKHDDTIIKDYLSKRKRGLVGLISSYLALFLFAGVLVSGMVYKARGENFSINNQTALVIKSGSMSQFFDEQTAAQYDNDTSLQFSIGDICIFSEQFDLVEGRVYGYKSYDRIITHRLVEIRPNGLCQFRGDANPTNDANLVPVDHIIYHYTGQRVPGVGAFILYAQSYFGLWSLSGLIGVAISSEIVAYRLAAIDKKRLKDLEVGL